MSDFPDLGFRVLWAWAGLVAQGGYIVFHCRSGGVLTTFGFQGFGFQGAGLLAQGGYTIFHCRCGGLRFRVSGPVALGWTAGPGWVHHLSLPVWGCAECKFRELRFWVSGRARLGWTAGPGWVHHLSLPVWGFKI